MSVKSAKTPQSQMEAPIPAYTLGTVQKVAVAAASAAITNAVASTTEVIRVAVNTDCYMKIAASPTATTSDHFLPAGTVEYFQITPGHKVAFIRNTADGVATVSELT